MTTLDLITRQDFELFRNELLSELKKLQIAPGATHPKEWLKSAEVRKLLKISPGTLQNLRVNGTLTYSRIGRIMYYKYADILKVLESNTTQNLGR